MPSTFLCVASGELLIFDTNQQFATHSRRFRILCIVDDFSRECLAALVDTSLGGVRVVRELPAAAPILQENVGVEDREDRYLPRRGLC